ncbi:hypothetical protein CYLTODRAFT_415500, partial [Cylindrobasidium torrendii FP15055 ss-10]
MFVPNGNSTFCMYTKCLNDIVAHSQHPWLWADPVCNCGFLLGELSTHSNMPLDNDIDRSLLGNSTDIGAVDARNADQVGPYMTDRSSSFIAFIRNNPAITRRLDDEDFRKFITMGVEASNADPDNPFGERSPTPITASADGPGHRPKCTEPGCDAGYFASKQTLK